MLSGGLPDRVSADVMRFPDDDALQALLAEIRAEVGHRGQPREPSAARVICPCFNLDGSLVRTITVAARFESVADVTLDEPRVELVYPEDAASEQFFRDRFRAAEEPSVTSRP